jgi:hypothetical protein
MTLVIHAVQVVIISLMGFIVLWKDGLSLFKIKRLQEMAGENRN